MAVFRVEKNRNYTVIANHHLRDKALSLKAKGLLTLMLSLPEDWDYTTAGLACICKEGVDSIGAAVRELERNGYLQRRRVRDGRGQLRECEYTILERPAAEGCPAQPVWENPAKSKRETAAHSRRKNPAQPGRENPARPKREEPAVGGPVRAFPVQAEPVPEKHAQLNTDPFNKKERNTQSFFPLGNEGTEGTVLSSKRETIREQIGYEAVCTPQNREQVDGFVELMLEVALSHSPTIRLGREAEYPAALVRERFSRLTCAHIERVLEGVAENTTQVRNMRAYLLSALFNAPSTAGSHRAMQSRGPRYELLA